MRGILTRSACGTLATLLVALGSTEALSQSAQGDQGSSVPKPAVDIGRRAFAPTEVDSKLEEITVTATRREESVEKVPISIDALSQGALTDAGIKSMEDVASVTPGLQFALPLGIVPNLTSISIRGLDTPTGASTVGLYLDDTPIMTRGSAVANVGNPYPAIFDLNRIEVARGPQGTLFGAGSEGGAVRFITNQPNLTEFSGFARSELSFTQGGDPSEELGAAFGGPVVPGFIGFRVSAWTRHDGGYVDRIDPLTQVTVDRNANTHDATALRAALAFEFADGQVRVTPSMFYQLGHVGDTALFWGIYSNPSSGILKNGSLLPNVSTDHFAVPSLKVEAHLPFADLTSTTSYMYRNLYSTFDASTAFFSAAPGGGYGSPLGPDFPTSASDASLSPTGQTVRGITQEIRLASSNPHAFLSWVTGIFFDHRTQRDFQTSYSLPIDPTGASILDINQFVTDTQFAFFAQGDLHLTDKLTLTLGERIAKVKSDQLNYNGSGIFNGGELPVTYAPTLRETPSTPRVALSYQADPNNLLYAAIGKGFRLGGGNAPLPTFCQSTEPGTYTSDYVWSYEVGAKDQLFNGRVQVDSSAFYINWSKIQQLVLLQCNILYTANAGDAVSKGADVAVQALVTDRLGLNIKVGYVNAYFTKNVYDAAGDPLILKGDAIGSLPQVNSPWDVNLSANYKIPLSQGDTLRVRGEFQYHSRNPGPFVTHIAASPAYIPLEVANPPTHMFNAKMIYVRDNIEATLFMNNVFNSQPLLGEYSASAASQLSTYSTFRPRTMGLALNLSF